MPALNFRPKFGPLVATGQKPHTIRGERKRPITKGDHLVLFTGQRTAQCKKLGEAITAVVKPIRIDPTYWAIFIDDRMVSRDDEEILSRMDGFTSPSDFWGFFTAPLEGQIIGWETITTPEGIVYPTPLSDCVYLQ